jgi:lipid A 4'-phosphatase
VLPIISKFLPIQKIYFGYKFSFPEIFFVWFSGIITMLLVVNVLLKNMWGRVRPNDILPFGGVETFTPWYKFGDSCLSNCSFVSGDASVGFLLVVFYFITKKNIYFYLAIVLGSVFGFIRIIAGGHFFSDIVFSQIIVTASILASFILYKKVCDK